MASLKSLKTRIESIKSTCKITQAMKLVAASKLKKARDAIEGNRPYTESVNKLAVCVANQVSFKEDMPIIYGRNLCAKEATYLFIVFGSDRGLCGSFNSNISKKLIKDVKALENSGSKVLIKCVGAKIYSILKWMTDSPIELIYTNANQLLLDVESFTKNIILQFQNEVFDICNVYYNSFVTAMSRDILSKKLLPIFSDKDKNEEIHFECNPSPEIIIDELVSTLIASNLTSISFETGASEHGARMTAMDSATRNAGEMIKKLVTLYNRTRQAAVTTELIEIISGAESIKGRR